MSQDRICPVCGNVEEPGPHSGYDCGACGFRGAYIRYFAGEKSRGVWMKMAAAARAEQSGKRRLRFASAGCFVAGSRMISFLSPGEGRLYLVPGNGMLKTEDHVREVSIGERNYAVLYEDGSVKVNGEENGAGQKNTEKWKEIRHVLAAPNCTYGITGSGEVIFAGFPADPQIAGWKNIRHICCGTDFAAGLRTDGTVCITGVLPAGADRETVKLWREITDLKAARDCLLGLRADGRVEFFGKAEDPRQSVKEWRDIIAICADNAYAYGLTADGEIRMAGKCKPILDRGRSEAKKWKNVVAISGNPSGFGAVSEDGELYFAGSMAGDIRNVREIWAESVRAAVSF